MLVVYVCFFLCYGDHRGLLVLTHSVPTRRASDLCSASVTPMPAARFALMNAWRSTASLVKANSSRIVFSLTPITPNMIAAQKPVRSLPAEQRSEEHTSQLQSLMRNSYAVFCLKKKKHNTNIAAQFNALKST